MPRLPSCFTRRLRARVDPWLGALAALSLLFAACAGSSAIAAPTGAPTVAPSAAPTQQPTVAPTATPTPTSTPCVSASVGPTGSGGTVIKEVADHLAFTNRELNAPAGTPISIDFDNQDVNVEHNILVTDGCGVTVFDGAVITGPSSTTYHLPALAAGTYSFICVIHPNYMKHGTLTVT